MSESNTGGPEMVNILQPMNTTQQQQQQQQPNTDTSNGTVNLDSHLSQLASNLNVSHPSPKR